MYEACVTSFNTLPVTALIDNKFFCVHGGISPELQVLADLDKVCLFWPRVVDSFTESNECLLSVQNLV